MLEQTEFFPQEDFGGNEYVVCPCCHTAIERTANWCYELELHLLEHPLNVHAWQLPIKIMTDKQALATYRLLDSTKERKTDWQHQPELLRSKEKPVSKRSYVPRTCKLIENEIYFD